MIQYIKKKYYCSIKINGKGNNGQSINFINTTPTTALALGLGLAQFSTLYYDKNSWDLVDLNINMFDSSEYIHQFIKKLCFTETFEK